MTWCLITLNWKANWVLIETQFHRTCIAQLCEHGHFSFNFAWITQNLVCVLLWNNLRVSIDNTSPSNGALDQTLKVIHFLSNKYITKLCVFLPPFSPFLLSSLPSVPLLLRCCYYRSFMKQKNATSQQDWKALMRNCIESIERFLLMLHWLHKHAKVLQFLFSVRDFKRRQISTGFHSRAQCTMSKRITRTWYCNRFGDYLCQTCVIRWWGFPSWRKLFHSI